MRMLKALIVFAALSTAGAGMAAPLEPVFRADFETSCADATLWRISDLLDRATQPDRIRCVEVSGGEGRRALAITVQPGDAYDANPGSNPTERAEIQLKAELIQFDRTTWYSFLFRVESPWLDKKNRTVIHQIKQNIDPRFQKGKGGDEVCDSANPFFKIEVDSNGSTPVFRAKTAGTFGCGDSVGQARFCGDWPIEADAWHRVNVMIRPSQTPGDSRLQLWLNGRACPLHTGVLGYPRCGISRDGLPFIDTQPRFGIYRDALAGRSQTILFDDIAFWSAPPTGDAAWRGMELSSVRDGDPPRP